MDNCRMGTRRGGRNNLVRVELLELQFEFFILFCVGQIQMVLCRMFDSNLSVLSETIHRQESCR
jgi:hypothetical protein